jgi:hypothetical protein
MTPPPNQSGQPRPRSKTPAERSEEFAAHQAKLKAEAMERRKTATARPAPTRPQSRRPG